MASTSKAPPVPLLVTDAEGVITDANPPALELLGACVGHDCASAVRAVGLDGAPVCAVCDLNAERESHARGTVSVRGEPTDLLCHVVGERRVIALVEGEPPREPLLSRREKEVLVLVARGLTNERIADRLGLGPSTVRTHMEHLLVKLGVHTRSQAVARALSLGEIE
jgi:DNA-binding CsgD family transcriptional regulator